MSDYKPNWKNAPNPMVETFNARDKQLTLDDYEQQQE